MDELVHHCLRELAFDGDLGCHPSRLRDFVAGYYSDSLQQVVDDAYFAFVWSLVVSQPTVRVGTVPDGTTTEVHIAPQQSQKRKVKGSVDDTQPVTLLALLPDARTTTLDDLQLKYGDTLRVAVDAETSFAAITGSHTRPPKLTPMVYTALQFITRGREHGISTVDLGKKTGYDQKACFYLIKQLLELELVVKLRRGGVGTNFCIHKYFFEHSPLWRQIQGEGASLSKDTRADEGGPDNEEAAVSPDGFQTPVEFDPIDARHLSSLSLIQSRIVRLLKNCKSYTHPSQNLLVTLGFPNPTKTDRRFFQSRLRELIENRVVERVMLPSTRNGQGPTPCIRLVPDNISAANVNESPATITREPAIQDVPDHQSSTIKLDTTLHKQMVDLLESAGTKGMTLNEISGALGNFDRRTLELLLTKLEKVPPPTHLSDLGIAQLMETHGRERRWRYFTVSSYRAIIANEKLDDQDGPYSSADFSNVGNFAPLVAEDFYGDTTELNRFMDFGFNRVAKAEDGTDETARRGAKSATLTTTSGGKVRGKKRGREEAGLDTDATECTPRKRGRPRKHPLKNQHDDPSIPKKVVTPSRKSRRSLHDLEKAQLEGTGREHRGASKVPSPRAPKKRRRPSDDNHVAPEGSLPPRRRDGPSSRPSSPVERPRSQNDGHTLGIPLSRHPSSEPRSSNPHASEVEAQSAPKAGGRGPQGSTDIEVQPGLIITDTRNHLSQDPTFNSNSFTSSQLTDPNASPNRIGEERVAGSDLETIAQTETLVGGSVIPRTASLEPALAGKKRKEKSATPHSRSNVSLLRRENEFLKILEESGGITHPGSKEFLDAHLALLDTLASAGEPTSGLSGVKVDKRTIESTFESLERRGKVKVLKTAISTMTGAQRPIRIIYFPTVDQSKLDAFLTELGKGPHNTPYSVNTPSVVGVLPGTPKVRRPARKVDNAGHRFKISGRADQLFETGDQAIRDVLLKERPVLPQLYEFVPEEIIRVREHHPGTLDVSQSRPNSPVPAVSGEKMRKKREWEAILKAVHPHALEGAAAARVARVRKRYLRSRVSSNKKSRWEDQVRDAIRDPESAAKAAPPFAQRTVLVQPSRSLASVPIAAPPPADLAAPLHLAGLPPVVASQPGKTIEQLITEQGPARENVGNKKRKRKKSQDVNLEGGNGGDDDQTHRRSRFLWNKDYDELAQDASAILRVRSRETGTRMDWFALNQIFPAVPKNSVRQRVASLREPQSNEIYMRRLEEHWTRLWKQYRGTEHLPDPNPRSPTDFNLIKHLQFLRRFVDKNALRVGFQETATSFILPETVSALQSSWDVKVQPDDGPIWEFLWDSRIDSSREKGLLQMAFTTESYEMPTSGSDSCGDREIQVVEAALKMIFGTPSEDYDSPRAANLLRSVGEEQLVSRAKDNLLSRGVLSKLVKDPNKPKPGRTLKISEINQNALGGSIVQDVFQDATTLETLCKYRDGWREWPLSASDGDLAMLAQMTSEGLVDFEVDITDAKAARTEIDWNSKKADDDHIETTIFARFASAPDADDVTESRAQSPLSEKDDNAGHGKTLEGTVACCRKYSDGLVNCDSCLNIALCGWYAQSNAKEREVCRHVLNILEAAGPTGLDMNTLVTKSMEQDDLESVVSVLESLMDNTIPLIVRVGHVRPRIVCSSQSAPWTAMVNEEPRINALPRRWLNSTGEKVRETWRAALRAVIGTVVFRPGISQAEIVWRLRSVYDEAEVIDVLRQLYEDGFLRQRVGANEQIWEVGLIPAWEKQEKEVFWFLGDRRWYHAGVAK